MKENMELFCVNEQGTRFSPERLPEHEAYWLHTTGLLIPVPIKHIRTVMDDPGTFGTNLGIILDTYRRFNEKPGTEEKTRDEILTQVLKRGWLRFRYNVKYDQWTSQVWQITPRVQQVLPAWVKMMIHQKRTSRYCELRVVITEDANRVILYSFEEYVERCRDV